MRILKSSFLIFVFATLAVAITYTLYPFVTASQQVYPDQKTALNKKSGPKMGTLSASVSNCAESTRSIQNRQRSRSILDSPLMQPQYIQRDGVGKLFAKAEVGDVASTITAFYVIYSCSPLNKSGIAKPTKFRLNLDVDKNFCAGVPLFVKRDPLALLEKTAQAGSPEARVLFALYAPSFAKMYLHIGGPGAGINYARMIAKAEIFGIRAAQDGYLEAQEFMANSYADVTFGANRIEDAYAFALALDQDSPTIDSKIRREYLQGMLPPSTTEKISLASPNCARPTIKDSFFASPF
jgi:hypothetical protein